MSYETKQYIIEYTRPNDFTYYMSDMIPGQDAYEAIDELKRYIVGFEVQNVFVKIDGNWNRDE